jgi:hypothetical protein
MTRNSGWYFLFFVLTLSVETIAQSFGNEWVQFFQPYNRISTAKNGIYQLDFNALSVNGFPVTSANPQYFQLWRRGKEVAILIHGEDDGVFNAGDYIQFYGRANDGKLEAGLYKDTTLQTHPNFSLYSDTASYFLTISSSQKGKRMQQFTGIDFSNPQPYHMEIAEQINKDIYNEARINEDDPKGSWGIGGEGWTSNSFGQNQSLTNVLPVSKLVTSGELPYAEIRLASAYPNDHSIQLDIINASTSSKETFTDIAFSGYKANTYKRTLSGFSVLSGTINVNITATELYNSYTCIAYSRLVYPQSFDMQGVTTKTFNLTASNTQSFINITNSAVSPLVFDVTDENNVIAIGSAVQSGDLKFNIPTTGLRNIFVTSSLSILSAAGINQASFEFLDPSGFDYFIVTHSDLITQANDYLAYRNSTAGGSHSALVQTIRKIYDQFSYGETNPLAVRNFCRYMLKTNTSKKRYMFILGQGLQVNYNYGGYARFNPSVIGTLKNYVPPIGIPPSDLLFTVGLDTSQNAVIPTARLAAKDGADITNYLNKVKEHEALTSTLDWRKDAVFLSGGRTTEEIVNFKNYITNFKTIFEGPYLGGSAQVLSKSIPGNTEIFNVSEEVNHGLSLLLTFGHTSTTLFDVDIGAASNPIYDYSNKGRYPMLYINGCQSGNAFVTNTTSNNWLLTPDKGAVIVLGHTDVGEAFTLSRFGNLFLTTAYADTAYLDKPISEIQLAVNKKFKVLYPNGNYTLAQTQQFLLQGDPAIKLFNPKLPDYFTSDGYLSIESLDGRKVTAQSDSFVLKFRVQNFGKYVTDSLRVKVTRTLSNGSKTITTKVFAPARTDQFYTFKIMKANDSYGLNSFQLCLNYNDTIKESDYTNNCGKLDFNVPLRGVACLFPVEFGIEAGNSVNFIAQSTDLLVGNRDYVYEIDTSYLFNSPVKITGIVANSGALVEFTENVFKNFTLKDSTVFFWRARYKSILANEDTIWGTSSFIYIANSPGGWSQALFPQFFKDQTQSIYRDTLNRKWNFTDSKIKIEAYTSGIGVTSACEQTYLKINDNYAVRPGGQCRDRGNCDGTFALAVSKSELKPYIFDLDGNKDYFDCIPLSNKFMGPVYGNFEVYLDMIPEGDYVIIVSSANQPASSWPATFKQKLKEFGALRVDLVKTGWPYIFIGQKGGLAIVELLPDTTSATAANAQNLIAIETINSSLNSGKITSTLIGPASKWGSLFRKFTPLETVNKDLWNLAIYGQDLTGNKAKLYSGQPGNGFDIKSIADAAKYPYLQLEATLSDTLALTPPQLKKWQVIYSGVPEGTLYFDSKFVDTTTYSIDTKQEGETFNLSFAFKNISQKAFDVDSLEVQYTLFNLTQQGKTIFTKQIKSPKPYSVTVFSQMFNTVSLTGTNYIQVYVNPKIVPELYYNNNIYDLPHFQVIGDSTNPLLDVTFDGKRISNGEKVSPKVLISVSLLDENKIYYKRDTSGFRMLLRKPCDAIYIDSCVYEQITLSSPDVTYSLGNPSNNNRFTVEYQASNLKTGTYRLWVNGTDSKNNLSGVKPYEVDFEVVEQCDILEFRTYPNPFKDGCSFYMNLICPEIISDLNIRISDLNGKIVREITNKDLSINKSGNNILNYFWNGTGDTGVRLNSGIYLYQLNATKPGSSSKIQKLGKIVIIR